MTDAESGRLDAFRLHDDPSYLLWLDEAAKRERDPFVLTRREGKKQHRCTVPGCGKFARKGGVCCAHFKGIQTIECEGGCGAKWTHDPAKGTPRSLCRPCDALRKAERMKRWREAKAEQLSQAA